MKQRCKHYSDGYVENFKQVHDILGGSRLYYIVCNEITSIRNTPENLAEMRELLLLDRYVPSLGNCEYADEHRELIETLLLKQARANKWLSTFDLRVKMPYVESRQPHICVPTTDDEKVLEIIRMYKDNDVRNKERLILDLI